MNLLIVTAFHKGDLDAAVRLYDWIAKLGKIDNDVVLVCEPDEDKFAQNRVVLAARKAARNVTRIFTKPGHKKGWPHGPNAAFLAGSEHAAKVRKSFLWLEPDCVPIGEGWIKAIEREYVACGKPYLGGVVDCKPPLPSKVLYGIAVYANQVHGIALKSKSIENGVAFDVALSESLVQKSASSKLFQIEKANSNPKLGKGIVLYHSDKTGSLIETFSQSVPSKVVHQNSANVSVVITSHNRLQRLSAAYQSCVEANADDIVITATGYEPKVADILKSQFPKARVVINQSENSNDAWIAGCRAAMHERITILHDDDKLLPAFSDEVVKHFDQPFCVWDAKFHNDDKTRSDTCSGPYEGYGIVKCRVLFNSLNVKDRLALTPVRGCFKKSDLIAWLSESGSRLRNECYYRPHYLIGNDLWIYLRASTKYDTFMSIQTPLTSLGCNSDSCTMDAIEHGVDKLVKIYNITRDVFNGEVSVKSQSLPLHIVTIVLDGAPFLLGQLQTFNRLKVPWKWSIVQGTSLPTHCTSWCKGIDARNSEDNTLEILNAFKHHRRINVISKPSWDGKVEMVNSALSKSNKSEIVLQVDMDEFWESWQIEKIHAMFVDRPDASHAMFWCRYFVGPGIVMTDKNCFANNPAHEWRRAWRRTKDQKFLSHEPPIMSGDQSVFVPHAETELQGLVFDHYSYVLPQQIRFKETYYGYAGAMRSWHMLQELDNPGNLSKHFSWAVNGGNLSVV